MFIVLDIVTSDVNKDLGSRPRTWITRPRPRPKDLSHKAKAQDLKLKAKTKAKDSRYQDQIFHRSSCIVFFAVKCCGCFYVRTLCFVLTAFCQLMNMLLLLMTVDKEERQTPKKMAIITKLATPRHAH